MLQEPTASWRWGGVRSRRTPSWSKLHPEGTTGPTDDYTDIAGDFQYERPLGKAQLTVHGT